MLTQDEHLTVTWSYGPLSLGEVRPDRITVNAAQGEIVDWGASIRHC